MECLIQHVDDTERRVIQLAGRLAYDQVPDLLFVCSQAGSLKVVLDLGDLLTADSAGVRALRSLRGGGATFVNMSEYIRIKLDLT
jgi:anti-anti-sigma regulatory factor